MNARKCLQTLNLPNHTLLGRSKKDRKMKIIYWAAAAIFGNTINFSVTGEGSIAEECEQDAKIKAEKENPLAKTITLQQVAIIA